MPGLNSGIEEPSLKRRGYWRDETRSTRLDGVINAAAVEIEDKSRFLSNEFTYLLPGDIKQISLASRAGQCMAAVMTGIAITRFADPRVLLDPVLSHQGAHKAATKMLLLDLHQREITEHILHASVQRSAIGLQQGVL